MPTGTAWKPVEPKDWPDGAYQAVVHFHGMGDQRRHAEASRLVDAFQSWTVVGRGANPHPGHLHGVRGRFDQGRTGDAPWVGHIELHHSPAAPAGGWTGEDEWTTRRRFRFYEAYWAPTTAKEIPAREVVGWLRGHLTRPVGVLRSDWRDHGRLRRSLLDARGDLAPDMQRILLGASLAFERPSAVVAFPEGSHDDFVHYLRDRAEATTGPDPGHQDTDSLLRDLRDHVRAGGRVDDVVAAAAAWRRQVRATCLAYQGVLATIVLILLLVLAALVTAGLALLGLAADQPWAAELLGDRTSASPLDVAALVGTVLLGGGVGRFLQRSLGDVMYWSTMRETDERHEVRARVLTTAVDTLTQVLQDPLCQRVVVTAHSLGTTIAYEALLELGRLDQAHDREYPPRGPIPIGKLDQFITFGSPIDKIHFFFESTRVTSPTLERVHTELHGDIGSYPFDFNGTAQIHWINLWDPADVVSGPLESPRSVLHPDRRPVDNVEVSLSTFPEPGSAHTGYLDDAGVVRILHDCIFNGRHTYAHAPTFGPGHPYPDRPDRDSQVLDDLSPPGRVRTVQAIALTVPWLVTVWWLARLTEASAVVAGAVGWLVVAMAVTGVVAAVRRRSRHPLTRVG